MPAEANFEALYLLRGRCGDGARAARGLPAGRVREYLIGSPVGGGGGGAEKIETMVYQYLSVSEFLFYASPHWDDNQISP